MPGLDSQGLFPQQDSDLPSSSPLRNIKAITTQWLPVQPSPSIQEGKQGGLPPKPGNTVWYGEESLAGCRSVKLICL